MNNITQQIQKWSKDHLGENFQFRENQLEIISFIIDDKVNNNTYHHIIQAPTGSGKSLINIISAGVLWEYYGKKSYILCSDLYLYKQYIDFFKKYNLSDFKYLKGATGNYFCPKGVCNARNAPCKMASLSYNTLYCIMNYDFDKIPEQYKKKCTQKVYNNFSCAKTCKYLDERFEACEAPITLMTYHLFYFQMNIARAKYDSHGKPLLGQFLYRENIFCDECHNIPSIMQSRCRPTINYDDLSKLLKIYNYYKSLKKNPQNIKFFQYCPNENEIKQLFSKYWKDMLNTKLESYDNTILLLNYTRKVVNYVCTCGDRIQKMFGTKVRNGYKLSDKEKEIYGYITWLQNYHCYLDDFCRAIELSGFHYTYKQISKDRKIVNFGTVKEDGIIFYFLLRYGLEGTTLVSATVGDIKTFKENCGFNFFNSEYEQYKEIANENGTTILNTTNNNVKYIDIDSNFNFEYSPIYLDMENKLNFKNKKTSIIPISKKINIILNEHYNENGIIQTGSYENAQNIYKLIDKEHKHRVLIYKNSEEKKKYIEMVTKNTNYVIMGPSLNEGIDLPGELCTFIIIAKVPYLSLGDKYVSTKMKLFKKWYNSVAVTNIIQGIGRGNRFKDDWCSVYILDGCFKRLYSYTKQSFPKFITNRFENVNIEKLFENTENRKRYA